MRLRREVFPGLFFELQPRRFELGGVFVVAVVPRLDVFVDHLAHRHVARIFFPLALFQHPHLSRGAFSARPSSTAVRVVGDVANLAALDGVEF